jgi:hypothetical protein
MRIQRCPSTVQSKVGPSPTLRHTTGGTDVPLQTNQASRPGGQRRRLSFGLTEEDIVAAQAEYPQHDVEKLLPRYLDVNEKLDGGVKAGKNPLKWLKGFLKTQRGGKGVSESRHSASTRDLSKLPKLVMKESKKDEDEPPYWKVGSKRFEDDEHIEEMRNMPKQSKASAHQLLCEIVGREWNTEAAFAEFGGDLFYWDSSDDTVEDATAFNRRYAEQRESEKVKEAVERIEEPKTIEPPAQVMSVVEIEPAESESEPEPVITPEPIPARPSHGDVREDGKIYSDQYGKWFPKDRWDNLERARKI